MARTASASIPGATDITAVVDTARRAFQSQTTPAPLRGEQALRRLEQAVRVHEDAILKALHDDLRKPELESVASEVSVFFQEVRELRRHLKTFFRPARKRSPAAFFRSISTVHRRPRGVVLIIAPWNYPVQLSLVPLAGAIASGNSVVLKPSEMAPNVASVLSVLVQEAFPDGLVQVVNGDRYVAETLLTHRFDHIFYTGNSAVGRLIMKAASQHLTPVTLELGGKSPVVVTRHANVRVAAERIAWGKGFNAGQTCVAPDYVAVDEAVHDEFVSSLKAAFSRMYGEVPLESPDLARIVNNRHYDRLCGLLDESRGVVWGGQREASNRAIAPAIVERVDWNDSLMSEELFAPVLPVLSYTSLDDLVSRINALPQPLALYVFSEKRREVEDIFNRIPSGGGSVNDVVIHVASSALPFGGVGDSGFGRYRGVYSLQTFTFERAVVTHYTFPELRFRYPPYKGKLKLMRMILRH